MTNLWTFSETVELPDAPIAGFDVYSTEGAIGTVEEVHRAADGAYLVVRMGRLRSTSKLVPAGLVRQISPEAEKVFLAADRSTLRDAPAFDEALRPLGPEDRDRLAVPFAAHTA